MANKHMALDPNYSMGVFKSRKMQTLDEIPEKHTWLIHTSANSYLHRNAVSLYDVFHHFLGYLNESIQQTKLKHSLPCTSQITSHIIRRIAHGRTYHLLLEMSLLGKRS